MLSTDQFFESFAAAGFTKTASWTPSAGGSVQTTEVMYRAPTEQVLGGEALAADYTMQFPASKFPGIKRGETVTIGGVTYKLREDPHSELNGTRLRAPLERQV